MSKLITFMIFIPTLLMAHPVIYKDGTVISSSNMPGFSDNQVMYSWFNRWASGINHWRISKDQNDTHMGFFKLNHLLYRYNGDDSQANIYLHAGVGAIDSQIEQRESKAGYMTGFEADWENRTLYTALKHYYFSAPEVTNIRMNQVRVGFAPYEAKFDQMQSWFMLQVMQMPEVDSELSVTPMLRFFYRNVLWEFGSSTQGDWMLNTMIHF